MLKRRQHNNRRPGFEQMESRDLLAAHTVYTDRAAFEATLDTPEIDGYEAVGYKSGDSADLPDSDRFTNAGMNGVVGETTYTPQRLLPPPAGTFDNNFVLHNTSTLYGVDNSYYQGGDNIILDFTTTSVGDANGVYGVGFDHGFSFLQTDLSVVDRFGEALVTFGDGTTVTVPIQIAGANEVQFFGVTSEAGIESIQVGLLVMPPNLPFMRMSLDNLTIGAEDQTEPPATIGDISDAVTDLRDQGAIGNITAIVLLYRLRRADRALGNGNEPRAIRLLERTNRTIRIGVFLGFISQADGANLSQLTTELIDSLQAS